MIEGLIEWYNCPHCSAKAKEDMVDIVGAAGNTVNIDVTCHECSKHSIIKAEVRQMNITNLNMSPERVQATLQAIQEKTGKNISLDTHIFEKINDEQIVDLSKKLKKESLNVSDFLWEE